jgi:hypothetical protein
MSTSPILGITLLQQLQASKYLTVDDAILALESASNGVKQIAMGDADQTPDPAIVTDNFVLQCQGALTADRQLILPNSFRFLLIHNLISGGYNIIVTTASGRQQVKVPVAEDIVTGSLGVVFGTTGAQLVYCDGQNNFWAAN